ncbi:nuclear transport factor 2 family protein [Pseudoalteromonas sp. McH1-7]|uniref:nuclear transport factor 2 family protein n=1 Tax=Pseudoalteromonas TaxID=53246 RepID=UPI000F646781|nr:MULTISPECIES: nuclear transport factor 2 family protein [Pseudoalteromonas]MDW7549072.1 nuclear transport factor 2 family protein [Pseudoalteromonas peptidolytica]NUZ09877.1 nuclear transport factor 2 family protein [Pseudoalteromonas sp. McH1-7]RRS09277.1 nuclear transport factor 2 family protein [Pseudoalteromonas sp. J010]USD30233.1 nuclear transport factor 2 family protein [Pseudoalteromonas sp. SCSIO 43201]
MTKAISKQQDLDKVTEVIQQYFEGLHQGDIKKLDVIFHADAVLKSPGVRRTKSQWLDLVSSRQTPKSQNAAFNYRILSVDVVNHQAMVKLYCPLFEHHYIDFIGLLKEDGQWCIVNKMYDDL